MKAWLLPIFVIFVSRATAAPHDRPVPPTTQDQYANSGLQITDAELAEMRSITARYSGSVPQLNVKMVRGVRSGSGGGGGIACFDNDEVAYAVTDHSTNAIKTGGERYIRWLIPFDAIHSETKVFAPNYFIAPRAGETPMSYLLRVVAERILPLNQSLASKLDSALRKVGDRSNPEKWRRSQSLPRLMDQGVGGQPTNPGSASDWAQVNAANLVKIQFMKLDHPDCPHAQYVQLAIQYNIPSRGAIVVDYAEPLLEIMNRTNLRTPGMSIVYEAMLILHETLYHMMVMKQSAYNSNSFRQLTSYLLSAQRLNPSVLSAADGML